MSGEDEMKVELRAIRRFIEKLSKDIVALRLSVHGDKVMKVHGVHSRLDDLEEKQDTLTISLGALDAAVNELRTAREAASNWLRGASWVATTFITLITVGGALGARSMINLLNEIAVNVQ